MRCLLLALATSVACGVIAFADEPGDLAVRNAKIRTTARVSGHRAKVTTAFHLDNELRGFDLGAEPARFALGPVDLLDKPANAPGVRVSRRRPWKFVYADRADGRRVKAKLNVATGVFRIRTRGIDLSPLQGSGPSDVLVRLELGDRVFESRIDFRAARRGWTHRGPRFPELPPAPSFPFKTLLSGSASPVLTAQTRVFSSEAEFSAFWQQIPGAGAVPSVDFTNALVVGVFLGARDDVLYSVDVTGGAVRGADLTVNYQETRPGPNCPASLQVAIPYPFTLARVPRVPGSVWFQALPTTVQNCF